ncbi:hypothetical protein DASC09_013790 [Saccharomycopsis crataegensis]|uniref:Uncharacterized protein n=1 Tax=Saccharomycopsis crataegensis TaxID=43959 RepID=A0AAV5QHB5_9ASCO|nr:hypothetical protein DASC09_013790 [Saccharomycopsis crataegensis]
MLKSILLELFSPLSSALALCLLSNYGWISESNAFAYFLGDSLVTHVLDNLFITLIKAYLSLSILYSLFFHGFCFYSVFENKWFNLAKFLLHVIFGRANANGFHINHDE